MLYIPTEYRTSTHSNPSQEVIVPVVDMNLVGTDVSVFYSILLQFIQTSCKPVKCFVVIYFTFESAHIAAIKFKMFSAKVK